jgi:hypothetical protein
MRYKIITVLILLIAGSIYFVFQHYRNSNSEYPPEINAVLSMAGANRSQLETVLKYYSRNPSDSLKLRAAEFLIANMPGKHSLEYDAPFEDVMAVYMRWDEHEEWKEVDRIFGVGKPTVKDDVKHITADYLINNIELSFKVWEEQPWGRNVPFDVFCEDILPYRVANEPLENWREKILESFSRLNRSFKKRPGITAVDACIEVNTQLPRLKLMGRMPEMNYSMIMTTTRGMCDEMSALAVFSMRALGIPVAQESTPKWPRRNIGHTWNSVYDSAGRRVSFMGTEAIPGVSHHGSYMPKSKVYRLTYARQNNIEAAKSNIPPMMRNRYMKDVTEEYVTGSGIVLEPHPEKGAGIEIPVRYPPADDTGYAWLASIGENKWNITGWGKTDAEIIRFGAIGRNILYLPLYYANGTQMAANYPFLVNDDDSIRIFEPDTENLLRLSVSEIFLAEDKYKDRMINGVVEGANQSDFSDATVLCTIKNASGLHFSKATIRNTGRFRYVRYVSPEKSHCHVAEIMFYNDKGDKLNGTPIGMPGSYQNSNMTFDKAFDEDISTFYDALLYSDSWMGLDLGEAQSVAEVRYLPHNDGNGIYEDHTYVLFCWKNNSWQSLEQQTAMTSPLYFKVPTNAVLHFKNITTGNNGRWFVVNRNGEQEWM